MDFTLNPISLYLSLCPGWRWFFFSPLLSSGLCCLCRKVLSCQVGSSVGTPSLSSQSSTVSPCTEGQKFSCLAVQFTDNSILFTPLFCLTDRFVWKYVFQLHVKELLKSNATSDLAPRAESCCLHLTRFDWK